MRPPIPLLLLGLALGGCASSIEGSRSEADAGSTVTPSFPDAAPAVPVADAEPAVLPCVEGDKQLTNPDDGTCYMMIHALNNWTGAQAACLALGANLLSIESAEEQTLVAGLAAQYPEGEEDLWIGASDTALEGSFVWVNQAAMVYSNWRDGEPNNNGPDNTGEDCAVIEGNAASGWDDRPCASLFPAICER